MKVLAILCALVTQIYPAILVVECFLTDRATYPDLPATDYTLRDLTTETILKVVAQYFEDTNPTLHDPGDLTGLTPLTASNLYNEHYGALGPPFDGNYDN